MDGVGTLRHIRRRMNDHERVKQQIETTCQRPLGPTLTALLTLEPCDYLSVSPDEAPKSTAERLRADHGIIVLGRTANGYFGVIETELRATVDASPIAYADRQGMPPELAAIHLGEFLGLLAFFPDFFQLRPFATNEWEADRKTFWEGRDDDEDLETIRALEAQPGVTSAKTAAVLSERLEAALTQVGKLRGFRHSFDATPELAPATGQLQTLDTTKAKIRAIEIRAYRYLGKSEKEIASLLGLDEATVRAVE